MNTESYAFGHDAVKTQMLQERNLEKCGQFIIPYLKPGLKILDCGCGPGTITVGFCDYIKHGHVTGVDIADEQLENARKLANKLNLKNISFEYANVTKLPFPDNIFDMVFSHAIFGHMPDPIAVLQEQKRVLKPSGILVVRDACWSGTRKCVYPSSDLIAESMKLYVRPMFDSLADSDIGLKLGALFDQIGLNNIKHNISCEVKVPQKIASFFIEEMNTRAYNKKLLQCGKLTVEQLKSYENAWNDFAKTAGAFYGLLWGEAIGVK